MDYDLEIDSIAQEVNSFGYKLVLLQFPDGLKQHAGKIVDILRQKTKAEYFIYFGSCFGACDIPLHLKSLGFEMLVQWGHSEFLKGGDW